jgi:transcriptional regulator GlxA family with amidase domain
MKHRNRDSAEQLHVRQAQPKLNTFLSLHWGPLYPSVLRFLQERVAAARSVVSICSGALMLAKAGLLSGLHATTHHDALEELALDAPDCTIWPEARVVDNGKIVVSAGISMGIEASLYTVAKHHGLAQALETARYMEYDWNYQFVDGRHIVVPAQREQAAC